MLLIRIVWFPVSVLMNIPKHEFGVFTARVVSYMPWHENVVYSHTFKSNTAAYLHARISALKYDVITTGTWRGETGIYWQVIYG